MFNLPPAVESCFLSHLCLFCRFFQQLREPTISVTIFFLNLGKNVQFHAFLTRNLLYNTCYNTEKEKLKA